MAKRVKMIPRLIMFPIWMDKELRKLSKRTGRPVAEHIRSLVGIYFGSGAPDV